MIIWLARDSRAIRRDWAGNEINRPVRKGVSFSFYILNKSTLFKIYREVKTDLTQTLTLIIIEKNWALRHLKTEAKNSSRFSVAVSFKVSYTLAS